jgi:hypothetical protein
MPVLLTGLKLMVSKVGEGRIRKDNAGIVQTQAIDSIIVKAPELCSYHLAKCATPIFVVSVVTFVFSIE